MSGPLHTLAKGVRLPKSQTMSYTRSRTGLTLLQTNEKEKETTVVSWSPPPQDTAANIGDFTTSADNYVARKSRAERTLQYLLQHPEELRENPTPYIADIRWFRYLSSIKHCKVLSHATDSQKDLIRLGLPRLFKTIWTDQLCVNSFGDWDGVKRDSTEAFYHITMAMWFISTNPTHQAEMFSELFEFVMVMLTGNAFALNYSKDKRMQDCLKALLGIVYQMVKNIDEAREVIRKNGGVGFLQRIAGYKPSYGRNVKGRALMILAYTLSEEEQKNMDVSESIIVFLITLLKDCLTTEDHRSTTHNYDAAEILSGLNRLAVADDNKITIGDNGGLQLYHQLLQIGTLPEMELACRGLWTLCFSQLAAEYVSENKEMFSALQKLTKSEHDLLRIAACGCLWTVQELLDHRKQKKKQAGPQRSAGHVMISYSWSVQKQAKDLRALLRENGYRVWMDIENMSGSTLSAMSQAIEKAAVVLMFVSEHYKDSPACRAEAEYAYKLQREIIPLKVQPGYSVDGWLSMLIGMKMSFDLTQPSELESVYQQLILALGDRGKGPAIDEREEERPIEAVDSAAIAVPTAPSPAVKNRTTVTAVSELPLRVLECASWSDHQVKEWIETNKLHDLHSRLGGDVNGEMLTEMRYMLLGEPDQYFALLRKDVHLLTADILRLSASLRTLQ